MMPLRFRFFLLISLFIYLIPITQHLHCIDQGESSSASTTSIAQITQAYLMANDPQDNTTPDVNSHFCHCGQSIFQIEANPVSFFPLNKLVPSPMLNSQLLVDQEFFSEKIKPPIA